MPEQIFGHLNPVGGGDPIPLKKKELVIGRAENCDIVLRFANVSSRHCLLTLRDGYWIVTDLDSRNGTKINGSRVTRKRIDPEDRLSVAKNDYVMNYSPIDNGAAGPPPKEDDIEVMMGASLMQLANLQKRNNFEASRRPGNRGGPPSPDSAGGR